MLAEYKRGGVVSISRTKEIYEVIAADFFPHLEKVERELREINGRAKVPVYVGEAPNLLFLVPEIEALNKDTLRIYTMARRKYYEQLKNFPREIAGMRCTIDFYVTSKGSKHWECM